MLVKSRNLSEEKNPPRSSTNIMLLLLRQKEQLYIHKCFDNLILKDMLEAKSGIFMRSCVQSKTNMKTPFVFQFYQKYKNSDFNV